MDDVKSTIYSCGRPHWLINDKLYFGNYRSFYHWEIQLHLAEGRFRDANTKSIYEYVRDANMTNIPIYGHTDPFPHRQLLRGGNAKPQWKCFLPERNETIELITKTESQWKSRTVHFLWENKHIGQIISSSLSDLIKGRVAQIFVEPQYEMLLPHLLGYAILVGIE